MSIHQLTTEQFRRLQSEAYYRQERDRLKNGVTNLKRKYDIPKLISALDQIHSLEWANELNDIQDLLEELRRL